MKKSENEVREILEEMFYVSEQANPNEFPVEGQVTWKQLFDAWFGEPETDEDWEKIADELSFYDLVNDEKDIEGAKKIYNDPEPLDFWVYDRYSDGTFIMYTLYGGDENSKWDTYEMVTDEIFNF